MKKNITWVMLSIMGLIVASCGSKVDPVAYNNEVITVINSSEKHIDDMNQAMVNADYESASKIQEDWKRSIHEDIERIEEIGDFKGDNKLQKAVLDGLKGYKKIVEEDYPRLIETRKNGTNDAETERTLLSNINDAFENMANGVNKASNEFAKDHLTNI